MDAVLKQLEADLRRIQQDIDKLNTLETNERVRRRFEELNEEWKRFKANADSFIWVNS